MARQKDVMGRGLRAKPSDQISNTRLRHHSAAGRWDFGATLDVEKDGAPGTSDRMGRIMLDFDKPSVWGVVQTHALLFKPSWWIAKIDTHMAVVVRQCRVINPSIPMGNCVKWKMGTFRQGGIIREDFPNFENAGRGALVLFALEGVRRVCRSGMLADAPGKAVAAIEDIPSRRGWHPFAILLLKSWSLPAEEFHSAAMETTICVEFPERTSAMTRGAMSQKPKRIRARMEIPRRRA